MSAPIVEIRGLLHRYPGGRFELRVEALEVAQGRAVAVIGPSGSGKTTLLNVLAGILPPERGRVTVAGANVSELGDAARRAFRVRSVGLVFQAFELLEHLSVLDNVLLPTRLSAALRADGAARGRAQGLLEALGLGDKARRTPRRLSQGERQRVGICRALVNDPPLVLADEPTGNLDPATAGQAVDELIEHTRGAGRTLIMVTHDHGLLDRFDEVIDIGAMTAAAAGSTAAAGAGGKAGGEA